MKLNPSVYIFIILYFSTSNWIITDYFFTPYQKNIILGVLLFCLLAFRISRRLNNFSIDFLIFSVIGLIACIANGLSNSSLFIQHGFLLIFSFYDFNKDEFIKIINGINIVLRVFCVLLIINFSLHVFFQDLIVYAGPITSTDLEMGSKIEIEHWIDYFGTTTNEIFYFFNNKIPRFGSYLTEPSAAPNLIFLPLLYEALFNKKKYVYNLFVIFVYTLIFRSGFVTLFFLISIIILTVERLRIVNLLSKKILSLALLFGFTILYFLPNIVFFYLENSKNISLFSFQNKDNTLIVRTIGAFEMLSNVTPFGNQNTPISGVGMIIHYLILYGYPILFLLWRVFQKLVANNKTLITYLFLFDLLILSKGFSSIFSFLLLMIYAKNSPSYY